MSEFLSEASVLIRPDTTKFRAELEAQLTAIIASAKVPPVVVPVATTALGAKGATAATAAATVAAEEQNAALRQQGAISAKVTAQTTELARAAQLQAQAESVLAGVTEAASLKTTELAAARTVLAQTSRAVALSERAVAAAVASEDAALIAATAETLALARAQQLAATSAVKETIALNASAAAAAESAAGHALAARGAAATGLSLLGARGATLAASSSFLIGAAAVTILAKSIKEASDETEELNKTAVVFGRSAKQVEEFASTTATSLGISRTEALKAVGVFGNLFRTIKISTPVAADMSTQLVRLASDLASFNNVDPSRTLDALRSGLVGQARPLRVFGIFLSAARVQEEALRETGKKRVSDLSEAEKVQARFNLILQDSALAQGDFARTADRAANQVRILKANLSDLAASLGGAVIPTLTLAVQDVNDLFAAFKQFQGLHIDIPVIKQIQDATKGSKGGIFGQLFLATPLGTILHPLDSVNQKLALLGKGLRLIPGVAQPAADDIEKVTKSVNDLLAAGRKTGGVAGINEILTGLDQLVAGLKDAGPVGELFAEQLQHLRDEIAKTGVIPANFDLRLTLRWVNLVQEIEARMADIRGVIAKLAKGTTIEVPLNLETKIDVAEAQGQSTLPLLREQLKKRTAFLERLLAAPGGAFPQSLIDQAARNVTATQNQIDSILDQQSADAKSAADDIKNRAKTVQDARDKQFEALADVFAGRQQSIEDAITRAGVTGNLSKEINLNQALIKSLKKERQVLLERLKTLKVSAEERKQVLDAIDAAIKNAQNDAISFRQQQAKNIQDALSTRLDLKIQLAEVTGNVKAQIAAHKAKLAELRKELKALQKAHKGNTNEALQLKIDIAEETKALNELGTQTKKRNDSLQKAEFAFLQTQKGFVSNLLGNLIPGSATAGLVGGGTGPVSAIQGQRPLPQQAVTQERTAAQGTQVRGATAGQLQTTNDRLDKILKAIQALNQNGQHPEAKHQRKVGSAIMDNVGGV